MTLLEQMANPEAGDLSDLIDLERYPIHDPTSSIWVELIHQARQQLALDGCLILPGFLRPEALELAAEEIASLATHIKIRKHSSTVYARRDLEALLPSDDPRVHRLVWNAGHVTRDMIPPYSIAHRVYVSSIFKSFIAACTHRDRIFEYADPLAGLVATVLPPQGSYPWHYDTNEFVVTIMTRKPEVGGRFEYSANLRTPGDENLAGLAEVLTGQRADLVRSVDMDPGDMQLFMGRYSLHRVTPTAGSSERHVMVFSYADRPGVIGPVDRTRAVYGRVTEAHLVAEELRSAASTSADGLIL